MVPQGFHRELLQNVARNRNKRKHLAHCQNVFLSPIGTKKTKIVTKKHELWIHTKVNILYVIPKIDTCFQQTFHNFCQHFFNGFGRQVWDFEIPPAAVGIPKKARLIPELDGVS